jgi:multidrug efflux pump subunit AcrA (membrane-fusion protein)
VATLFSTKAAEIVVPLEDESLFWIDVPGFTTDRGPGADVIVSARFAGQDVRWQGRVVRAEGKLDERTRLVEVVVRVDSPYATRPPLAVGLFVTVEIIGKRLEQAAVIPRPALRADDMVWIVDRDGRLSFRKVKVARLTADTALIESGLKNGDLVVTSGLKAVTEGMRVRFKPPGKEISS